MGRDPIDPTYSELAQRLKEARLNAGYKSVREAAKKMGVSTQTVMSHEGPVRSNRKPKLDVLRKYAELYGVTIEWLEGHSKVSYLPAAKAEPVPSPKIVQSSRTGVPILGTAQAGHWLEFDPLTQDAEMRAIDAPDVGNGRRFAVQIAGTSMNKVFDAGDIVICKPWSDIGRNPADGDILLVQRMRTGFIETTIKRYKAGQLWPESTDEQWQTPVPVKNGDEIHIVGLAVARFQKL